MQSECAIVHWNKREKIFYLRIRLGNIRLRECKMYINRLMIVVRTIHPDMEIGILNNLPYRRIEKILIRND